jgi:hypothetical protein
VTTFPALEAALEANDKDSILRLFGYEFDLRRRIELERDGLIESIKTIAANSQPKTEKRQISSSESAEGPARRERLTSPRQEKKVQSKPPSRPKTQAVEIEL